MHHRPFDQARDLAQQRLVLDPCQALGGGELGGARGDHALALAVVEHHLGRVEIEAVVAGAVDDDAVGPVEAVARGQVGGGEVAEAERHRGAVEHAQDRMQRPHPAHLVAAPAHRFGPADGGQGPGQDLGKHLGRGPSLAHPDRVQHLAPCVVALLEPVAVEADRFEEPVDRPLRGRRRAAPCARRRGRAGLSGNPSTSSVRRRGEANDCVRERPRRASSSAAATARSRSAAARRCIRAGSPRTAARAAARALARTFAARPPRRPRPGSRARPRSSPWRAPARGRYRRRARSPRRRRARRAG